MAVYKVPQDVEADDKLIGPFSFRQFIYLIIVVMAGAIAWGLAQLFIVLAIIPLPVMLLFGALALPLRKDQPMEIYLAAMISYALKPRKRMWDPEGVESLIQITAPRIVEEVRTKGISSDDADQRFTYLANLVDTQGWAIRGAAAPVASGGMSSEMLMEAQNAEDVLDTGTSVARSFDTMMDRSTERIREEAMARMHMPAPEAAPTPVQNPFITPQEPTLPFAAVPADQQPLPAYQPAIDAQQQMQQQAPIVQSNPYTQFTQVEPQAAPVFNPYPEFQQAVIQPLNDTQHQYVDPTPVAQSAPVPEPTPEPVQEPTPKPETTTSEKPISADIMNLANNPDLSIETIAREAHRIQDKKEEKSEDLIISLR